MRPGRRASAPDRPLPRETCGQGPRAARGPPVDGRLGSFGPPGSRRPSAPGGIGRRTPTRPIWDGRWRPRQAPSWLTLSACSLSLSNPSHKTRTVTGRAASSGTSALSTAPNAPATVPNGTRRLRRPSTTFPPRATRPLPAHFRVISTNSHSCGRARALSPPQQFYKAPATEGEETISFFRPHEVSPPTSASLEPASSSGTLEQRRTGSTFTGGWRHTKSGQPKAP